MALTDRHAPEKSQTRAIRIGVTVKLFKKKTTVPNRYGSNYEF